MSLSPEELKGFTVALPGDLILCPECHEPLVKFTTPTFEKAILLPAARPQDSTAGRMKLYCQCGAGGLRVAAYGETHGIEDGIGPRAYVRSGSWTGWRALGGE